MPWQSLFCWGSQVIQSKIDREKKKLSQELINYIFCYSSFLISVIIAITGRDPYTASELVARPVQPK